MSDVPTETPAETTPAAAEAAAPQVEEPAPKEETQKEEVAAEEVKPTADEEVKPAESEAATEAPAVAEGAASAAAADEESKPEEEKKEEAIPEPEPEPIIIPEGNGELVLVTGITGYLASHIFKQLVDCGQFRVRGTVRSIEENKKLDELKSLAQSSKYEPEFVEADLTKPESWAEAVKECEYVIHVASPFPVTEPSDANEVIEPARDGTLAVLKACVEAGTVKRVVLTSSIAAINSGRTIDKNACTEEMWADVEKSPSAYDKSKAIAEKAAWDYIKDLPEGNTMELSVVNPGFIVGPPLLNRDCTSIEVIKKLMNREYSILPKISFACSDVRDVALAHIRAMMIKQAAGHRHIVCGASVWLKDMANIMSKEFSSQGFNIPTTQAPYVLVWLKSQFDPVIKRILPSVGKIYNFDTRRMKEILQVEPRDVKDTLLEMGHAMINLEIVQKVEKPEKKNRKLTFRNKKKEKDLEEGEEKKDEPEKAASTSGSAENAAVTIEDVEVTTEEKAEPKADEPKADEPQVEEKSEEPAEATEEIKAITTEEKPAEGAASHSEEETKDEATTSDPESSTKKDKKEKAKKEKKEKKKGGGLFSFSFKKHKKPHVEKKAEEGAADDKAEAKEEAAAATTEEETPATTEEAPAATEEAPVATEESSAAAEETPAATEETPAKDEETPAKAQESAAATEEAAASTEETTAEVENIPENKEETDAAPKEPTKSEEASAEATKTDDAPAGDN